MTKKPEFGDVIARINDAWKQYSMGEYDKTLTECRKALEALISLIRNKGLEREIQEEELEKYLAEGWKFVSVLPSRRILIKKDGRFL